MYKPKTQTIKGGSKITIGDGDTIKLFNINTVKTDSFKKAMGTISQDEHITLDVSSFLQGPKFNQENAFIELQKILINAGLDDNITLVGQPADWMVYSNYGQN